MSTRALRPHPRHPVLNGFIEGICLRWKTWFKHLSPARHTSGWHSYIIDRLIQSDSGLHGASSSARQLHCEISSSWARWISTFPIGTFAYTEQQNLVQILAKWFLLFSHQIQNNIRVHGISTTQIKYNMKSVLSCMPWRVCMVVVFCHHVALHNSLYEMMSVPAMQL